MLQIVADFVAIGPELIDFEDQGLRLGVCLSTDLENL